MPIYLYICSIKKNLPLGGSMLSTEMIMDSQCRPRGNEVTISCRLNTCLLLQLHQERIIATVLQKTKLTWNPTVLSLQWQSDYFLLPLLGWNAIHTSSKLLLFPKLSSPGSSHLLCLLQQGQNSILSATVHAGLHHVGTS